MMRLYFNSYGKILLHKPLRELPAVLMSLPVSLAAPPAVQVQVVVMLHASL